MVAQSLATSVIFTVRRTRRKTTIHMTRIFSQVIIRFSVIAFVTFVWQFASTVAQDKEKAQDVFETSLDRAFNSDDLEWLPEQNRLLLKGKVNDAPAVFKIDSGAIGTLLTLKSAKERSLRVIDFNATFTGAGGTGKIYGSPVKKLQLGTSIDLANQRLAVIELPFLDGVDGLVGGDTLASTKAIIDYRHKKIRVPKDTSGNSLEEIATDSGMSIENLEREGNYVFAKMNYGDEPLRMFVDTGAQKTLIGAAAAARLKMTVQETDDRVVGAGDDAPKLQKTSLDRLSLGKTSFVKFDCVVMSVDYLGSYSKTPIDGILGADALVRSNSILSIADAVLVLDKDVVDMTSKETSRKQ